MNVLNKKFKKIVRLRYLFQGDSGAPLMKFDDTDYKHQYWYLVGVVSFGPNECGKADWPGVYTRVDKHLNWILDNVVY